MTPLSVDDAGLTSNACFTSKSGAVEDEEDINDVNDEVMKSAYHEEGVEDRHTVQLLLHVVWIPAFVLFVLKRVFCQKCFF